MARGSVADIAIKLVANSDGLAKGLTNAERQLNRFKSQANAISRGAVGGFGNIANAMTGLGSALSIGGAAAGLKAAISRLDDLGDRASGIGETVANLEQMDYIATRMGSNGEAATMGMTKLIKVIGEARTKGGEAKSALEGLGLSVEDLAQMSPTQAFQSVADAIGQLPGIYSQASAAASIFGKNFGELMPLFADPGAITEYADDFDRLHGDVNKAGEVAGEAQDQFDRFGEALEGFGENAVIAFGPSVTKLMENAANALGDFNNAADSSQITEFANGMKEAIEKLSPIIKGFKFGITELSNATEYLYGLIQSESPDKASARATSAINQDKLKKHMDKSLSFRNRVESVQKGMTPAQAIMDDAKRRMVSDAYDFMNPKPGTTSTSKAANSKPKTTGEQAERNRATEREKDKLKKLGESITDDVLTPMEKYAKKMDELDEALRAGTITQETWARAEQKYWDEATKAVNDHAKAIDKATQKQRAAEGLDRYASQMSWLDNMAAFNEPAGGFVGGNVPANFRYFTDPATSAMQGGRSVWTAADMYNMADQAAADLQASQGDPQLDEANSYLRQIVENTADMGIVA